MRLTDLEPQFLQSVGSTGCRHVATFAEADGVMFLCPKCFAANGGPRGTHAIICWEPTVPQEQSPSGGRWTLVGTGFDDLSLVAASSSILLSGEGSCGAHFYVKDGAIVGC